MRKSMVYFEEEQFMRLKELAKQKKVSVASICRDAVSTYIEQHSSTNQQTRDPLFSIVGMAKSSSKNKDSEDHDHILYGKK